MNIINDGDFSARGRILELATLLFMISFRWGTLEPSGISLLKNNMVINLFGQKTTRQPISWSRDSWRKLQSGSQNCLRPSMPHMNVLLFWTEGCGLAQQTRARPPLRGRGGSRDAPEVRSESKGRLGKAPGGARLKLFFSKQLWESWWSRLSSARSWDDW